MKKHILAVMLIEESPHFLPRILTFYKSAYEEEKQITYPDKTQDKTCESREYDESVG